MNIGPLYDAGAAAMQEQLAPRIAKLEAERDQLREQLKEERLTSEDEARKRDEHFAENKQLRAALRETREALAFVIGDHSVPGDCYSSGPVTGTPLDAICPSCRGIAVLARHAALAEGGERG